MKKFFAVMFITLIISLFLVSISIFLPAKANSFGELNNLSFGYPIPFISQDLSFVGYEGGYPHRFDINFDFLDPVIVIKFNKIHFISSVLIIWIFIASYPIWRVLN